jgi:dolichol-phosphate mannosyltransferase
MSAGLEYATGEAVILIDADLQDPPTMIKDFIDKWKEGYDVVYGIRKKREGPILMRIFYKVFYKIFNKTSDVVIPLNASEFGLMNRKVVEQIKKMPEKIRFIRGLRAWVGFKQIGIPYTRERRKKGKAKFRIFDGLVLAMDGILSFSTRILTFTTLIGFFTIIISTLLLLYILIWKFTSGDSIPGYTAIIVSVSFFSGIIIFMLGISGAYIERIFLEVKSRPKFLVEETWGFNK